MAELDDEITRLIRGGEHKIKAPAEADPYAEMETTFKKGYEREPPSISVGGKEVKLEKPPEPTISPFDIARGRRNVAAKAAEAATEKARLEASVEASAAERMKGIAGRAREMEAPPRFTPTPEDKATMVGMFGLLGAMAAFIGGGKQYGNALSAMNAMGGMLAGYNQGRKDLFEKDKQIYDKKVAENKAHNDHIKQLINTAMEEAKYDYAKAKANLKLKLAEVDAPVIKAQVDQKTLEDLRSDVEKADLAYTNNLKASADLIQKMKGGLESQKRSWVVVNNEEKYLTDAEIVQAQNEGKRVSQAARPSAAGEKPLSVSAAEKKNYVGLSQMVDTTTELIKKLEDPEFAKKVDQYRLGAFLSEEGGKIASQVLRQKIPEDVQDFINKATALRNKYYLEISGKAVTGGEAMRNYNVVPQPGMNAQRLRQTLKSLQDNAAGDLESYRKMYPRLPDLTKGGKVVTVGPDAETTTTPEKFATQADVQETARVRFNGNVEAAKKALRERGFTIEGE